MIKLDIDAQGIATLIIDQPGRALNVIDWSFATELNERIDQIAGDPRVAAVIVTSGKGSFVAGADLAIMKDFIAPGVTPKDAAQMIGRLGAVLRRLETLGKPVVGASTGTALGGGLELLLACHYRIAADAPAAVYGLPEVGLGLLPGAGGTQRLPRLIGMAKSLPLMLSGRHLSGQEALEHGIFHRVVPREQLLDAARQALADGCVPSQAPWDQKGYRIPGGDSNSAPGNELFLLLNAGNASRNHGLQPAPRAIASCVYEGSRLPIDRALRIEQLYFAQLVQGPEAQAMIRTLFFARQAQEKATGRPDHIPRTKLGRIAVVGSAPWYLALQQAAQAAGLQVQTVPDAGCELVAGTVAGAIALGWFQNEARDLPPMLEIAPDAATTDEQLARAFDLARQLRAVPVLLGRTASAGTSSSFVVTCLAGAVAAARELVAAGVSPVVLNNTLVASGWPSLAAMAAAAGCAWPTGGASRPAGEIPIPAVLAGQIQDAQRRAAEDATSRGLLSADAANLAAVLGAGFPRHLGGPLAPSRSA